MIIAAFLLFLFCTLLRIGAPKPGQLEVKTVSAFFIILATVQIVLVT